MKISEAQQRVDAWISKFEEGYWPPLTNLARLIEEVDQDLAIELADVLFVVLVIANEQGIDLDESLERVFEKYQTRDSDRWAPVEK
jgi:NTP pyrophosphatase (non-canonical NTP hydrolase)